MKKIEAIIKPFKLDEVKNALSEIGIDELTTCEVKGFGRQKTHAEIFRGTEYLVDFLPEIKIELVLQDNRLDAAVAAIIKGTQSNKTNDRRVFVSQVDDAFQGHAEKLTQQAA